LLAEASPDEFYWPMVPRSTVPAERRATRQKRACQNFFEADLLLAGELVIAVDREIDAAESRFFEDSSTRSRCR
jgi:hypothetical protein